MNLYEILKKEQIELLIKSGMKIENKNMTEEEEKNFNMELALNPNLSEEQIISIFDTIDDETNY